MRLRATVLGRTNFHRVATWSRLPEHDVFNRLSVVCLAVDVKHATSRLFALIIDLVAVRRSDVQVQVRATCATPELAKKPLGQETSDRTSCVLPLERNCNIALLSSVALKPRSHFRVQRSPRFSTGVSRIVVFRSLRS